MNEAKTIRSGVKGVYMRRLSVTPSDVQAHRRLVNYLKVYFSAYGIPGGIDPLSRKILESVPALSFVPCFILAWTLIRFNELEQISIPVIKTLQPFEIASSKSDNIRLIQPLASYKIHTLLAVPDRTDILVISYDSLCNSIRAAKSKNNIDIGDTALDCTHIFRHLAASYMHFLKIPVEIISKRLGHKINKTTHQYIHKSLFSSSKKLKKE